MSLHKRNVVLEAYAIFWVLWGEKNVTPATPNIAVPSSWHLNDRIKNYTCNCLVTSIVRVHCQVGGITSETPLGVSVRSFTKEESSILNMGGVIYELKSQTEENRTQWAKHSVHLSLCFLTTGDLRFSPPQPPHSVGLFPQTVSQHSPSVSSVAFWQAAVIATTNTTNTIATWNLWILNRGDPDLAQCWRRPLGRSGHSTLK